MGAVILSELVAHKIAGHDIALPVTRSPRVKRIRISMDRRDNTFSITAPLCTSIKEIQQNVEAVEDWILKHVLNTVIKKQLIPGDELCLLGDQYVLEHHSWYGRVRATVNGKKIKIYCNKDSFSIAAISYLKIFAKKKFSKICENYAAKLNKGINRITVRDTTSRWGSCSEEGNISLSWRLLLAPKEVATYVCIHEVCHLVEMNHSKAFWSLVAGFCPDYKDHMEWLKLNGQSLHELY